jgi:uncharacterized RDD family membrane protein YckC
MTDQERPSDPGTSPEGSRLPEGTPSERTPPEQQPIPESDQPTVGWTAPTPPSSAPVPSGWGSESGTATTPPPDQPVPPPATPAGTPWGTPPSPPPAPPTGPLLSASPAPTATWVQAPSAQPEVAPGLVFSGTPARFVAYLIDGVLLLIVSIVVAIAFGASAGVSFGRDAASSVGFVAGLIVLAIDAAYFIGLWTTRRATLGQMMLNIQVGNAFDGKLLTLSQAGIRWFLLSGVTGVVQLILPALGVLATVLWGIVLLISTVSSPTKQGLHDRFAGSAVVRPVGASNALIWTCLIVIVVLLVAPVLLVASLGTQMSTILSQIGQSV